MIIYPFGITLLYFYKLYMNLDDIKNGEARENNEAIQSIGFLWKDYRPEYWWFEIFENMRRFFFTAVTKMDWFPNGSPLQMALLLLVAHICIHVYGMTCPFREFDENLTARFGQWVIFFQLLISLVATAREHASTQGTINISDNTYWGVFLIIMNLLVAFLVGLGVILPFFFKWKTEKRFTVKIPKLKRCVIADLFTILSSSTLFYLTLYLARLVHLSQF